MQKLIQQSNTRWLIYQVLSYAKQINMIDFKLPMNVTEITGIAISPANIMGDFSNIQFGELSLSFNNKKVQPVHLEVQWKTFNYQMKDLLLPFYEKVEPFSRVSGFHRNYLDINYTYKIYLRYNV